MISKEVAASSERIIQSLAAISEDIHEVRERQVEELARQEIVLKRLAENEQLRMENLRFQQQQLQLKEKIKHLEQQVYGSQHPSRQGMNHSPPNL